MDELDGWMMNWIDGRVGGWMAGCLLWFPRTPSNDAGSMQLRECHRPRTRVHRFFWARTLGTFIRKLGQAFFTETLELSSSLTTFF